MYSTITVAVDNSPCSEYAEDITLQVAISGKTPVTGIHAYTGKFHQARFRALENHLPEKYRSEEELNRQRDIHSVLIGRGLELISLEYMKRLSDACRAGGVAFTEKIVDGKNADVIVSASDETGLTVMGADGIGRTEGIPGLGSTTRRMLRHGKGDLLVVRKRVRIGSILAGVDGSPEAFAMAGKASDLARSLGATLTIAAAYDPGLHRTVFGSLSATLSKEAGNVFKFSEQEKLHNDIIDRSLADLYSRHLETAVAIAREHGTCAKTILEQGKPFLVLCTLAKELGSDLVVVGHSGMHRSRYADIGSNTERVAELAGTNVLVVRNCAAGSTPSGWETDTGNESSGGDTTAPEKTEIHWNADAKKRLEKVPGFARPMAILAIERYAKERGISEITPDVMNAAREKLGI
ncbi:MAG: universal stress protein [Methanoregulaceae archaeon]